MKAKIDAEVKELKSHFKEDRWDINYEFLLDDALYSMFGFHVVDYVKESVLKNIDNVIIKKREDGTNIISYTKMNQVYYDTKKNKIVLKKELSEYTLEKGTLIPQFDVMMARYRKEPIECERYAYIGEL